MHVSHLFDAEARRKLLRFIAVRVRNNPHDIEDIAQIVHLRLLQRTDRGLLRKPWAYLFVTARNVIHDYFDANRRLNDHVIYDTQQAESAAEKPPLALDAPTETQKVDEDSDLERAARTLPKTIRMVIELSCKEGLSVSEIAKQAGLAQATVVKYRTVGKHLLQDYLKDT